MHPRDHAWNVRASSTRGTSAGSRRRPRRGAAPPFRTSPQDRLHRQSRRSKRTHPEGATMSMVLVMLYTISVPEVRAPDRVVLLQVGRRAFHDDAARLEEIGVVGEIQRDR